MINIYVPADQAAYPIVPTFSPGSELDDHLIDEPDGSRLTMHRHSRIASRRFDLSTGFEFIRTGRIGLNGFEER